MWDVKCSQGRPGQTRTAGHFMLKSKAFQVAQPLLSDPSLPTSGGRAFTVTTVQMLPGLLSWIQVFTRHQVVFTWCWAILRATWPSTRAEVFTDFSVWKSPGGPVKTKMLGPTQVVYTIGLGQALIIWISNTLSLGVTENHCSRNVTLKCYHGNKGSPCQFQTLVSSFKKMFLSLLRYIWQSKIIYI